MRDPRLAGPVLAAARDAGKRRWASRDPYLFGFGMQDVIGQAEGLSPSAPRSPADRRGRARRHHRDKLRPLLAPRSTLRAARSRAWHAPMLPTTARRWSALVARFDARTEQERAISRRLGLGDCLARPVV